MSSRPSRLDLPAPPSSRSLAIICSRPRRKRSEARRRRDIRRREVRIGAAYAQAVNLAKGIARHRADGFSAADVEDIARDALVRTMKDGPRRGISSPSGLYWFLRQAIDTLRKRLRRRGKFFAEMDESLAQDDPFLDPEVVHFGRVLTIIGDTGKSVVDQMGPVYRDVVIRRFDFDVPLNAVSRAPNPSDDTVKRATRELNERVLRVLEARLDEAIKGSAEEFLVSTAIRLAKNPRQMKEALAIVRFRKSR